jgi:hypothetical protein
MSRSPAGLLRAALVAVAALAAGACGTIPPVPLDPGWTRVPETEPAVLSYTAGDVEVRARRIGDPHDVEPSEVAGAILRRAPGEATAEFLPPPDGIGAVRVVVTTTGGASVPSSTPGTDTITRRVLAAPGQRFPLSRSAPDAPASISFRLLPPDELDAGTRSVDKNLRACTVVIHADGVSVAIPFRFRFEDPSGTETTTFMLLLCALAGGIIYAGTL